MNDPDPIEQIREVAEKACQEAFRKRESLKGACVNWGDFGVTEVSRRILIRLEEADPRNEAVISLVYDRLKQAGIDIDEVEVVAEW